MEDFSSQLNQALSNARLDDQRTRMQAMVHQVPWLAKASGLGTSDLGAGVIPLNKVEKEDAIQKAFERRLVRRAALVDPNINSGFGVGGFGPYKPKYSHISNKVLKAISLRDPVVAAIIQARVVQVSNLAIPQRTKYDMGFKFEARDKNLKIQADSIEQQEIEWLNEYIMNTGLTTDRFPQEKLSFGDFLKMMVRDRMTYGSFAIEKVPDQMGRLHHFLPVPTETVYFANNRYNPDVIESVKDINRATYDWAGRGDTYEGYREQAAEMEDRLKTGEYAYLQVVDSRIIEAFTRDDLIFSIGNPQNFIDNNGYPISELEQCATTITTHLQSLNYNKQFFVNGFAARGIFHIKGDVERTQLDAFRVQFYNQIAGNQNSWRTPIIAGVDDVQWIPLSATNRDMEYSNYVDHLIRTIAGIFQISPMEFGFDYLDRGSNQRSIGESNNEWKIKASQDRGLLPLLRWIEDVINGEILPLADARLAQKYRFVFAGYNAETRTEELERQQAEISLHATMNEVRSEMEKDSVIGGDLVLNPAYLDTLFKTHTIGEIREIVFKYAGDSQNPQWAYAESMGYLQNQQLIMQQQQMAMQQQMMTQQQAMAQQNPGGQDAAADPMADLSSHVEGVVGEHFSGGGKENENPFKKAVAESFGLMKAGKLKPRIPPPIKNPKKIHDRFDDLRDHYLQVSADIHRQMIDKISGVIDKNFSGK